MKKRSFLLLSVLPLGAGLWFLDDPVPPSVHEQTPRVAAPVAPLPDASEIEVREGTGEPSAAIPDFAYAPARLVYLETLLLEGEPRQRREALRELEALGTDESVSALSIALGDEDERIVNAALEALARIGTDDAVAAIASMATDTDPIARARGAQALGSADSYSSVDYLSLALRDEDPRVRGAALESLGDLGDSRSINIIGAALRDSDAGVRERAVELLDEMSDEAMFHALYPPQ